MRGRRLVVNAPTRYGSYTVNGVAKFVPDRYHVQPPRRWTLTATYTF